MRGRGRGRLAVHRRRRGAGVGHRQVAQSVQQSHQRFQDIVLVEDAMSQSMV